MKDVIRIWKETITLLATRPSLCIPFVVVAVCNSIALYLLFLAPQSPVSIVLAPPIARFFGQRFLTYPSHLLLIPKLYYYAQIVLSASVGVIMTGLAIGMAKDVYSGKKPRILVNLVNAFRRSLVLFSIWAVMFAIVFVLRKGINAIGPGKMPALLFAVISYYFIMLIQIFFVYVMPAAMIDKRNLLGSLKDGLRFFFRFLTPTIVLTLVPATLYLPVIFVNQKMPFLINKFFPEVIVIVVAGGIIVTFVIDIFYTLCPTFMFLKKKDESK